MLVNNQPLRTVWQDPDDPDAFQIIDQRALPFRLITERIATVEEAALAIRDMHVRGAGCIGATAGWAMFLAARECLTGAGLDHARLEALAAQLMATRPTAVNLRWAVERQLRVLLEAGAGADAVNIARSEAAAICEEDVAACRAIGQHGLALIREIAARKPGQPVNILTHCNAGWLAFVDIGSATAPIYAAQAAGIPVHVWVDETRPRNQGARLTAWELGMQGVPHTIIADNAGGHLMQHCQVDLVITGADRVTRAGDVANKIGTYLKALAARDCGIPFCVAFPSSTIDWQISDGLREIPIEERSAREVTHLSGIRTPATIGGNVDGVNSVDIDSSGANVRAAEEEEFLISAPGSPAANPAFDVTPARLISWLITEHGCMPPSALATHAPAG